MEVPKVFRRYSRQGEERVRLCYERPKGFGEQSKAEKGQSSEVWVWYLAESAQPLEEGEA